MNWQAAHRKVQEVQVEKAGVLRKEVDSLLDAKRTGADRETGHALFFDYVRTELDETGRAAGELVRLVEGLEECDQVRTALSEGRLSRSSARELVRVTTLATQGAWLAAVAGKSVREVEALVSGHQKGDLPDTPVDPQLRRKVVSAEVSATTAALLKEARGQLAKRLGQRVDDDTFYLELAKALLAGGDRDERKSSYQIAFHVCSECGDGTQDAGGARVPVDAAAINAAFCDATIVDLTHVGLPNKQQIPPHTRCEVLARDHGRCRVPWCSNFLWVDVHHITPRELGGSNHPDNLLSLCSTHHHQHHRHQLLLEGTHQARLEFRQPDQHVCAPS